MRFFEGFFYILCPQGPDSLTKTLHDRLMARKKIYIIAATFRDKHILRFVVCSRTTESRDIIFAWEEIRGQADQVLLGNNPDSDTPMSIRKTHGRIKTRKECPSNELKANGITSGQAWFSEYLIVH
jgi:hypothetical protein